MAEWVTIHKEQFHTDAYLVKSVLDFEEIEVFLLDELSSQYASFVSPTTNGIRIQVREHDVKRAMEILIEKGYITPYKAEPNKVYTALSNYTQKIPFLKRMRTETAVISLVAIVVTVALIIIFVFTKDLK